MQALEKKEWQVLLLILLLGFSLRATGSILFPLWSGPEELSHFFHIQFIAENGKLPAFPFNQQILTGIEKETIYQPPLYYMAAAPFYLLGAGQSDFIIVHLLRLLSVVFGTACIALTYLIAKKLSFSKTVCIASALFIALLPTNVVVSSTIDNSALSWVFCLAAIYYCIAAIQEKKTKDMLLASLFFTLTIFTKFTAMGVAMPFAIAAFAFILKGKGNIIKRIAACAIPIALIAIPLRNFILYNSFMPVIKELPMQINLEWLAYFSTHLFAGIWLQEYGTATIPDYRIIFFGFFAIVSAIAFIGFLALMLGKEWNGERKKAISAMIIFPILLNLGYIVYYNIFHVCPEARWLLATIGLAAILFMAGLAQFAKLIKQENKSNWLILLTLIVLLIFDFVLLWNYNSTLPPVPWTVPA